MQIHEIPIRCIGIEFFILQPQNGYAFLLARQLQLAVLQYLHPVIQQHLLQMRIYGGNRFMISRHIIHRCHCNRLFYQLYNRLHCILCSSAPIDQISCDNNDVRCTHTDFAKQMLLMIPKACSMQIGQLYNSKSRKRGRKLRTAHPQMTYIQTAVLMIRECECCGSECSPGHRICFFLHMISSLPDLRYNTCGDTYETAYCIHRLQCGRCYH